MCTVQREASVLTSKEPLKPLDIKRKAIIYDSLPV